MYRILVIICVSFLFFSCNRKVATETSTIEDNTPMEENETVPSELNDNDDIVNNAVSAAEAKEMMAKKKAKASEAAVSPYQNLELDIFGNKYIYSDVELIKINVKGDTVAVFNTRSTLAISSVAVTNPNNVIVYSRDNQRTWTLDSTLSVIEEKRIDLPELGEIGYVTRLEGDDILYYSRSSKKFYRTNSSNNKILESDVQWTMESPIKEIIESQDLFIVRNEDNEVYLFDAFGNLVKEVKVDFNDGPVDFKNNFIYQIEGNQLRYLDLADPTAEFKEYKLSSGLKNVSDFKMGRQKVYALTNGKVVEQKIMIVTY